MGALADSLAVAAVTPSWLYGAARARLARGKRPQVEPRPIDRIERGDLGAVLAGGQPKVLSGFLRQFEFFSLLQPDVLKEAFADRKVSVFVNEAKEVGFEQQSKLQPLRVGELIDHVFGTGPRANARYYTRWGAPPIVPRAELAAIQTGRAFDHCGTWIGEKGNITPSHWDIWYGCLGMLTGRKLATLFPPDEVFSVYPQPLFSRRYNLLRQSRLPDDYRNADPASFPEVTRAVRYEATLEPGDVLHIPPGWWHQIVSLDPAISVAFRYSVQRADIPTTTRMLLHWQSLLNSTGISRGRPVSEEAGDPWALGRPMEPGEVPYRAELRDAATRLKTRS